LKHIVHEQLGKTIAVLEKVRADETLLAVVAQAAEVTAEAMLQGRKLMVAGNGGSAADAQHLVAEFVSRLVKDRPALRAISLTVDSSILTAVGNDYGYEKCFERQIEALGQQGDVFLGISTSGNSPNVLRALALCRTLGVVTIGFSGNGGGKMAPLCDYNVIVPCDTTMNIQESHLALEHIYCMLVERCYFGASFFSQEILI
jgi:D-sedoheptulose 7-phosphate isomerase